MRSLGVLLVAAGAALAAEPITGPVAGYVTGQSAPELRAIVGVPGALRFGDRLALPDGITRLRLAPRQGYALAERGNAPMAALVLAAGGVDHLTPLEGAMVSADWVAFSARGGAAVLYSAAAGRLQVVTGLPDSPVVATEIDAAAFGDTPVAAALDENAALVAVASRGAAWVVPKSGAPRLVLSGQRIVSLAVAVNGRDLAVADAGAEAIQVVVNAASTPEARVLASGLTDLAEIFPGADGATLYAAAGTVLRVDMASGSAESFAADAPAVELVALASADTFLFSARPGSPGWIFCREGSAGRVVFIPADSGGRRQPARGGVR